MEDVMGKIKNYILRKIWSTPAKNPLTGDTTKQRLNEYLCKVNGCVTYGEYYTMYDQATCRRCGHKNRCANDLVKEWSLPD